MTPFRTCRKDLTFFHLNVTVAENISGFSFDVEILRLDLDGRDVSRVALQVAEVRLHEVRHFDGRRLFGDDVDAVDDRDLDESLQAFVQVLLRQKRNLIKSFIKKKLDRKFSVGLQEIEQGGSPTGSVNH